MYERFTDRARKVMQLANQEAQRFNHEYIGTEHILLGLVKEGSGVAANVLKNLDIDLRRIRLEVEKLCVPGPDMVTMGKIPQTPRCKEAIKLAIEESELMGDNHVGTEHLLLGVIRIEEGMAAKALTACGVNAGAIRSATVELVEGYKKQKPATPHVVTFEKLLNVPSMTFNLGAESTSCVTKLCKLLIESSPQERERIFAIVDTLKSNAIDSTKVLAECLVRFKALEQFGERLAAVEAMLKKPSGECGPDATIG